MIMFSSTCLIDILVTAVRKQNNRKDHQKWIGSVIYCRASAECNQILASLSLDGRYGEEAVSVENWKLLFWECLRLQMSLL